MSAENRPVRTTLFFKYFKITFSILFITAIANCFVFSIFMVNYWTSNNVETLKRNVAYLVNAVEEFYENNENDDDFDDEYRKLYIDFRTVSDALDGDCFMADESGNIVICRDLVGKNLEVLQNNSKFCRVHGGVKVNFDILKKTTSEGYYTLESMKGLGRELSIIVGQMATAKNGNTIGYVYGTISVPKSLNVYMWNMVKMFAGATAVSLVFSFVLVYIFSYKLTQPLREMSRITKLYARGDFSQRIKISGNDEFSDLCEKLNQMADSLEVIDESRSAFVANVSHELKSPMTSIGGFIDGILDGTINDADKKKYLRIVSDEVKRLSDLVETMLTLSKIEAGEERLHPVETDIKHLLFVVLLNFEKQIEERNIEIIGFEKMPECTVVADEKMLYQVIYNLYDNAVKFTNEGGKIYVDLDPAGNSVKITISNTGVGIKSSELIHIFERFYKADQSRSEYVKGVGLGLNLAKNIVELHGGEISAESIPGELTSFSFRIPKKQ